MCTKSARRRSRPAALGPLRLPGAFWGLFEARPGVTARLVADTPVLEAAARSASQPYLFSLSDLSSGSARLDKK